MICGQRSLLSPAAETRTVLEQDNRSVSERSPCLVSEFAEIWLHVAEQEYRHIALEPDGYLTATLF